MQQFKNRYNLFYMDWKEIARIYKSTSPQLKRNVKPAKEGNSFRFQLKLCLSILPLNILQKYYCSATGDGMDYSRWYNFFISFCSTFIFSQAYKPGWRRQWWPRCRARKQRIISWCIRKDWYCYHHLSLTSTMFNYHQLNPTFFR